MSLLEDSESLRIPFVDIKEATKNFTTLIGKGGYGLVYKGDLLLSGKLTPVAVKRLQFGVSGQGFKEFLTEIQLLTRYKHPNLISLIGFCNEDEEKLLIYEYAEHGSLDKYLSTAENRRTLTWKRRLNICVNAARGLNYLHNQADTNERVIHRDIKSANVLLDQSWKAMISDLGLSKLGRANEKDTYLITNASGTYGYCDPVYRKSGILTKESDVYSFGVVLFEVLCGRLCVIDVHNEHRFLPQLAKSYYKKGQINEIMDPELHNELDSDSLKKFSDIAFKCILKTREQRPSMHWVLQNLTRLHDQNLQGPMKKDTLKSHFEKIIMIWQKQHYRKAQKDNQDPKQLQQPHGSHALALSQVCPNNLNGGPVLTPLDLNDAISPSPDFVPVGYQGPHTSGLPVPNHSVAGMVPGSNSASSLPGSSAKALGSHLASASAPLSPSVREGRYGIPRGGSLSVDKQHRMQQFNQMSARNMQQTSLPPGSNSGTDRGVRILPGGAGMGVIGGVNRGMAMARPGFQGISTPMLNSGMTSAIGPGRNSVRPRETMRMMRGQQQFSSSPYNNPTGGWQLEQNYDVPERDNGERNSLILNGQMNQNIDHVYDIDDRVDSNALEEDGPGVEDFQVIGDAKPGGRLLCCANSVRGTSLAMFQWVRYHRDCTMEYIEGATDPEYVVTADDVDKLISVECIPMDDQGRKGQIVRLFANEQNEVTCDPKMEQEIDNYMLAGEASFDVSLLMKMPQMQQSSSQQDQLQQQQLQLQQQQNNRKRKQHSSSGPANSTGTGNTAGPSPSSPASTHTPGDGVTTASSLQHGNNVQKSMMMYGADGTGGIASSTNQLDDIEHFGDVGPLDDNVESFLQHDAGDYSTLKQTITEHKTASSKGFSFGEVGCIRTRNKVTCCHFSSDGKLLASAGHDKKAVLWNMDTLQTESTPEEHQYVITDIRFRPNSTQLATASFDKSVRIWDAANPSYCLHAHTGHTAHVISLDFHPKKNDLFSFCDSNNEIRYWNLSPFQCTRISKQEGSAQVRFQPVTGHLLAAASDKVVSIFDVENDRQTHSFQAHSGVVNYVCWDLNGDYLASVSEESVKVWSLASGECIHELASNGNQFHSCVFHPSYSTLLVIGGTRSLELWNMTENKRMTVQAHDTIIAALAQSPVTGMIASASHDSSVKLWK